MFLTLTDSIYRDKATYLDKVGPRNNNKAKSSNAKGTSAPEDGQLLMTETCRVTWDTNILMFLRCVFLKKCKF
jgi:hypothetical protein